jgi:thiamine biosynthesis lipoprotein
MGTVVSVHIVLADDAGPLPGAEDPDVDAAIEGCLTSLRTDEATFTPFAASSEVRRIARGDLTLEDASPVVREVHAACQEALVTTEGRFDAWWQGWFDPTGYVKGWSVERAYRAHLAPLLDRPGTVAVGVSCGGDLRVGTAPAAVGGTGWSWRTGVVDPHDRTRLVATLELTDGAVATSGTAERGAHIVDPRTRAPARGALPGGTTSAVASATVVSDRLDHADLWATSAVVSGFEDLTWVAGAGTRSGLLVAADGRTRRWAAGVELIDAEDVPPGASLRP